MRYKHSRIRGVHLGVAGYIAPEWKYKILASYRTSWGTAFFPLADTQHDMSGLIECVYSPIKLSGWSFSASLAEIGASYMEINGVLLSVSGKVEF